MSSDEFSGVHVDELVAALNAHGGYGSITDVHANGVGISASGYSTELPMPATEEGKRKKNKKAKEVSDALKIDMASERTFFKWFRTGMQIGAIGTFVFISLDNRKGSLWGVATVAFTWAVGFALVLYGLWSYYTRRETVRTGRFSRIHEIARKHSPLAVVLALVSVVVAGLLYAALNGDVAIENGHRLVAASSSRASAAVAAATVVQ